MVIVYITIGLIAWAVLYAIVLKVGLYIEDKIHEVSIKRFKTDIEDYEFNRFKLKLYVTLFFVGIPTLFFIGCIINFKKGL